MPPKKSRGFVFTINNYCQEEIELVKNIKCQAIKAGFEIGENGTPHIQGAIYFKNQISFKSLERQLGGRAHLESMKGNWDQQDYCLKDEDILRNEGQGPESGKRKDIADFRDAIKRKASDAELAEDFPTQCAKFPKFINFVRNAFIENNNEMPEVIVYWGDSGVGKTRKVYELEKELFDFSYDGSQDWWDGYNGQEAIIFDDFYGQVKYSNMLKYCDRYPQRLAIKGGFTKKAWKRVYFTSNKHPKDWWQTGLGAMERRISKIIHFDKVFN